MRDDPNVRFITFFTNVDENDGLPNKPDPNGNVRSIKQNCMRQKQCICTDDGYNRLANGVATVKIMAKWASDCAHLASTPKCSVYFSRTPSPPPSPPPPSPPPPSPSPPPPSPSPPSPSPPPPSPPPPSMPQTVEGAPEVEGQPTIQEASTCASFMYPSPTCTDCNGFICGSLSSTQLQGMCTTACAAGRRLDEMAPTRRRLDEMAICPTGHFLNPTCLTCSGVDCSALSLTTGGT
eukprot:scaffold17568_cov56-Phaeocystis_antarctica.AAC.1